jgi:putative transposase
MWNTDCAECCVRTGNPGHLKTFDYVGLHRYFLTFCTYDRLKRFVDGGHVDVVREQILRVATEESFAVSAYRFMPDHLHLLVEACSDASDCLTFIKRAKQFSGFYYAKQFRERLWQRYGYERTLRREDETLVVAKYVVANPVRAGLVENPEEYAFSGSQTHSLAEILSAIGDFKGSG